MNNESTVKVNHKMWFLLLVPILIWYVFTRYGMDCFSADSLGALFSGLAFMGVAIGLYFQTREINMQREELKLQREEMAENRKVMKEQEEQLKKQKEAMEQQLVNQKVSSTMDYFLKLLQSHIEFAESELKKDISLYYEDLHLSDAFFGSSHRCLVERRTDITAIDYVLENELPKKHLHIARRFVLSLSLTLKAYEQLVQDPSFPERSKKDILGIIKSCIPLYQLCLFYYFAVHHNTYKADNELKKLIIKYLLDNFHKEIIKYIVSSKDQITLEKVNGYSEKYFTIMSEGVKESITSRYTELTNSE